MRQVTEQFKIGRVIEQIEREVKIRGHSIMVGLEIDGETHLFGQPLPAFDKRYAIGNLAWPHIRLNVQMLDTQAVVRWPESSMQSPWDLHLKRLGQQRH
jgi:hypothetical protein